MPRFLLAPQDEAELHAWLANELSLIAITGPVHQGRPCAQSLAGFPWELPGPAVPYPTSGPPREVVYWRGDWPVNDLPELGVGTALHRVKELINAPLLPSHGELLDVERTRVLVWRRCGWTTTGAMHVGALHGSRRPVKAQDPEVAALVRQIHRWLKKDGEAVVLPKSYAYRPSIFARPAAAHLLAGGLEVSPYEG